MISQNAGASIGTPSKIEPLKLKEGFWQTAEAAQPVQTPSPFPDRIMEDVKPIDLPDNFYKTPGQKTANEISPEKRESLGVLVSDDQWRTIREAISTSDKPEEDLQRYASAITFSREYGVPIETAMQNLEEFTQYQLGESYTPTQSTAQALANSFKVGAAVMDRIKLAMDFRQADLNGEDTSAIDAQMKQYDQQIDSLRDYTPRNWVVSALKSFGENSSYLFDIAGQSLAVSGATYLALNAIAQASGVALAGTGGISAPLVAGIAVPTAAVILTAGAAAGTYKRAMELEQAQLYYELRQNGVDPDIANYASSASGVVTGIMESAFDILGSKLITDALGKGAAKTLSSRLTAKLAISGKLGGFVTGVTGYTLNAAGEFPQEYVEAISTWMASETAYELSNIIPPERSTPILQDAFQQGMSGFAVGMVSGLFGGAANIVGNMQDAVALKQKASSFDSEVAFIKSQETAMPENVEPAVWDEAMSTVWKKEHDGKNVSTAIQSEESAVNELDAKEGKTPSGIVRRLNTGELFTKDSDVVTTDTTGAEHHQMLVGDPVSGKRYGTVDYSIMDNSLEISDVLVRSGYESIRKEAVLSLAKQYPGYDITWDAKGENLQGIKNEIIEANPRGKEAGVQYFDGVTNVDERIALDKTIKDSFTNLSASQVSAGSTLLQLAAKAKGMDTTAFMESLSKDGKLFESITSEQLNNPKAKGAVKFDQDMKALVYVAEKADFSTFVHETFHILRRTMGQTEQLQDAFSEAAKTPELVQYIDEHRPIFSDGMFTSMSAEEIAQSLSTFTDTWTRVQEEAAAKLYESYRSDGTVSNKNLEGIFKRIAQWMNQIYQGLKHTVAINPEIAKVFDFFVTENASVTDSETVSGTEQVAQEPLFQEAPPIDSKEFKAWFGDSKVVDAQGNPLVLYHGTTKNFSKFESKKSANTDRAITRLFGFFFTEDKNDAERYATWNLANGTILETYLSIQKPYHISFPEFDAIAMHDFNKMKEAGFKYTKEDAKKWEKESIELVRETKQSLIDQGYDGIFVEDRFVNSGSVFEYIAFSPTQVKSVNNKGSWDSANPNILFQEAQRQYDAVVSEYTGTEGWMKAPNGKATNLNERQWVMVRTPAFLSWFGDWMNNPSSVAQALDLNGEPEVFYHGSYTDLITVFEQQASLGYYGEHSRGGFSFTNKKDGAKSFAVPEKVRMRSIQNYLTAVEDALLEEGINDSRSLVEGETLNEKSQKFYELIKNSEDVGYFGEEQSLPDFEYVYWDEESDSFKNGRRQWSHTIPKLIEKDFPSLAKKLRAASKNVKLRGVTTPKVYEVFLKIPEGTNSKNLTRGTLYEVGTYFDVREEQTKAFVVNMPNDEKVVYIGESAMIKSVDNDGTFLDNPNILFQEAPPDYQPKSTGIGYKVFVQKDGKLYPPMVANPNGEGTPVGKWLLADEAPIAEYSKTGRPQVKSGGKGTQGKSGLLAYRPGWHLGEIPYAKQFNRLNPATGNKELFPKDFVWAEVEYSKDNDYNDEARQNGVSKNGGFSHALASLYRMPTDGFYNYRTNPDPTTDPWVITGAMKVNKILTREEVDTIVKDAGRDPQKVEGDSILFQEDGNPKFETDFPKRPDIDMFDYMDDLEGYVKIMDDWEDTLREWVDKAPDMLQFGNEEIIHLIHKNVQPEEGVWRETSFINFKGEWIPSGHSGYNTKYEAVKEGMDSKDYRPDILFQEAYHGTGGTFDKFDPEHMGEGEGSQAYGWGFYLTSSFGVSNNYRTIAAYDPDKMKINGKLLTDEYDRVERMANKGNTWMYDILGGLESLMMHETRATVMGQLEENEADPRAIRYFKDARYKTFGNVYRTSFSDDLNVVDYYKPLSQDNYTKMVETLKQMGYDQDNEDYMNDLLDSLNPEMTSSTIYGIISGTMEDDMDQKRATSEFFDSIGINGFHYPSKDQAGNESDIDTNYVIFDPANIKIDSPVLFQEAQAVNHEQILQDAKGFDTWEGLKYYYEGLYAYDIWGEPLEESYQDDEWYQAIFNEANGVVTPETPQAQDQKTTKIISETEQQKDDYFTEKMSTDEGISKFIGQMGWALTTKDYEHGSPGSQKEVDYATMIYDMRVSLPDDVHPTVLANAYRMSGGKSLTPKMIKGLRTLMTGEPIRYYRDIYADLMEDPDLKPQVIDERLPTIDEPGYEELDNLNITERINLAKDLQEPQLRKKFLSGKETMQGDAEMFIDINDRKIAKLNKQITVAEKEIEDTKDQLSDAENTLVMLFRSQTQAQQMLNKELKAIKAKNDNMEAVPQADLKSTFTLQSKLRQLHEQIIKQRASQKVQATVKRHEALDALKAQLKEKQAAKDEARKVREYKLKLARKVMVKPSDAIDWEYAQKMYKLQATMDPKFRRDLSLEGVDQERLTLEEAQDFMAEVGDDEIREALGDNIYKRIMDQRKPLNEWTVEEMEELAETMANLRDTGRQVLAAKNEQKRIVAESYQREIIKTLMQTGKYIPRPIYGTAEEQKQRNSARGKYQAFRYVALPMRVKAMMLDNNTEGSAYDLLITQKRTNQGVEWASTEKRQKPIFDLMKEVGLTETDLYKTVSVSLGDVQQKWTYSSLMYAWLSQFEESNRLAVSYGTLVTVDDKIQLKHDNELIKALGDARYTQLLNHAKHYLVDTDESGKYMALVKAIQKDFNGQVDRINEVAIREYNQPMRAVDEYLPIHRKEITGTDLKQNVADDWFNVNAGGMATSVSKGFTKTRINISPDHQGNTDMDLMNVWDRSVRQQEHMIAFAEYGRKLNRVFKNLGSRETQNFINQTYGTAMMDDINDYIDEVMNPQSFERKKGSERMVKTMRGNLGAAYLAWKMSTLVLQAITSPMPFLSDVNPVNLIQGYVDMGLHYHSVWEFVQSKSQMMKNRSPNIIIDQILQQSKTYTDNRVVRLNRKQQEIGTIGLTLVDRFAVAGGWLAAYRQQLAKLGSEGMTSDQADKQAALYADDVVLRTQPTGDKTELSPLFKTGGEFAKIITQFQTALNVIWANTTYDIPNMIKDSKNKSLPKAVRIKQFERAVGQVVGYVLAGAILGAVQEGHEPDDEPKDKVANYVYWSLTQFLDSSPLIGQGVNEIAKSAITGEKPQFYGSDIFPAISNILDASVDISQGTRYAMEGELEKAKANYIKSLKNMAEGFGYGFGAPVSGTKQLFKSTKEGPGAFLGR